MRRLEMWGRPEFRGKDNWRGWGGPRTPNAEPGHGSGPLSARNAGFAHAIVFDPDTRFGRNTAHAPYRRLEANEALARDLEWLSKALAQSDGDRAAKAPLRDRLTILAGRCQWVVQAQQREHLQKQVDQLWSELGQA